MSSDPFVKVAFPKNIKIRLIAFRPSKKILSVNACELPRSSKKPSTNKIMPNVMDRYTMMVKSPDTSALGGYKIGAITGSKKNSRTFWIVLIRITCQIS
jgi:hypothetical protein